MSGYLYQGEGHVVTHIALVEDDPGFQRQILDYLDRYSQASGEEFKVCTFGDGDSIISSYRAQYDVILMDIQMKFVDGMTAAREIREVDDQVLIIFITSLAAYAVKGYEVDALDYVLKPVSYPAFAKSMSRAMGRLRRRKSRYVSIGGKNGAQRVDCARIYYIEADGHSLSYHTADGRLSGTGTMKELEATLADSWFFRCGKGVLVNLEHVSAIVEGDAVVHGETVQVSRARRKEFLAAFNRYINEVGQ